MTRPECPKCHAPMPWSGRQQCHNCLWPYEAPKPFTRGRFWRPSSGRTVGLVVMPSASAVKLCGEVDKIRLENRAMRDGPSMSFRAVEAPGSAEVERAVNEGITRLVLGGPYARVEYDLAKRWPGAAFTVELSRHYAGHVTVNARPRFDGAEMPSADELREFLRYNGPAVLEWVVEVEVDGRKDAPGPDLSTAVGCRCRPLIGGRGATITALDGGIVTVVHDLDGEIKLRLAYFKIAFDIQRPDGTWVKASEWTAPTKVAPPDRRSDPITASELATSRSAVVKKQLDGAMRDITRRIDEQVYAPKQYERWAPGVDGKTLTFEGAPREHKS